MNDFNEGIDGLSEEQIRTLLNLPTPEQSAENLRQHHEASKLIERPISDWPEFEVLWDLSKSAQRFAFDGMSSDEFAVFFPNGLELCFVSLSELDDKLCAFNVRTPDEVWGIGSNGKAARVMLDWIEGRKITPPVLSRTNHTSEICLHGGNHRLAVARAKLEESVPVLIEPEHHGFIASNLAIYSPWPR